MSNILRLDSRDRSAESKSNTDFVINFVPVHARVLRVKQIIIPNLFPNIRALPTSDANSTFSYETGGVPASFVIPTGYYTITSLITYLETQLTALSITFVQDANTGLITLTNGGGSTFEVINLADGNSLANVLGITTTTTVNPAGSTTFGNRPNMYNYSMVYVMSRKLSNSYNLVSGEQRLPIIATIPVDVVFGANINYTPDVQHEVVFEGDHNIEDADIALVNHSGDVLDLPSNHHWQILVECEKTHVR